MLESDNFALKMKKKKKSWNALLFSSSSFVVSLPPSLQAHSGNLE